MNIQNEIKKLLLINEGNHSNLGDSVINESIIYLFKQRGYEVDFYNYSRVTKKDCSYVGKGILLSLVQSVKALFPNQFKWYLKNRHKLKKISNSYSFAIIGGGQLINGGNFTYSLYYWTKALRRMRIPVYVLHVGCGKSFTAKDIRLLKIALSQCKAVYVRDHESQKTLFSMEIFNVKIIPDPAYISFKLTEKSIHDRKYITFFPASYQHVVKNLKELNISKNSYFKMFLDTYKEEQALSKGKRIRISYSDILQDKTEATDLVRYLKKYNLPNVELYIVRNQFELINLVKSSRCVISSRLHPLIIGKSCNTKLKPIVVSSKISSFLHQLNTEDIKSITSKIESVYNEFPT